MLPPLQNSSVTAGTAQKLKRQEPKFGRMAVTDSSELKSRFWPGEADSYHYQELKKRQSKRIAAEIYHPTDKTKAPGAQVNGATQDPVAENGATQDLVAQNDPADGSSDSAKGPSLQKTRDQIDHDAPRGFWMNVPAFTENTSEVVGNVALDLYRLVTLPVSLPLKFTTWLGGKGYNKAFPVDPETQQRKTHEKAVRLVHQLRSEVDMSNLQNEDGEPIPQEDAEARIYAAITQKPEFMSVTSAAVSNQAANWLKRTTPPYLFLHTVPNAAEYIVRWPFQAQSHLPTLVNKLVNLDFNEVEPDHGHAAMSSQSEVEEADPFLAKARRLAVDVGHSETESIVHELEVSGSMPAKIGRTAALGLSKGVPFPTTIDARQWFGKDGWFRPMNQRDISEKEFAQIIKAGKLPPTKNPHRFAVVNKQDSEIKLYPKGVWQSIKNVATWSNPKPILTHRMPLQVHSTNNNIKMLLGVMTRGMEAKDIPDFEPDAVMSVKVRNTKKFKENVLQPLVNTFRITDKVTLKNGKQVEIKEACLWPFIEAVLSEGKSGLGPNCKVKGTDQDCFDLLADAKVFKFKSSDKKLEKFLNRRLQDQHDPVMRELRAKLAVIQVLSLQYAEQVDLKETISAMAKGAAVGIGGEMAIEHFVPHPKEGTFLMKQPSYWANWALMSLVDAYDNWQGEQGSLEADLKGMGLKNSPKDVFGNDEKPSTLQNIKRHAKLFLKRDADGPAGMSVGTAQFSAVQGAVLGGLVSLGTAFPFTSKDTSDGILSLASGATALGTAFSIPLSYGYTKPRVMLAYNEALKKGLLKLPTGVNKHDRKAVEAHIEQMATQDMMARIGLQASAKAYTIVAPAMASLWALRRAGVPRETVQALAFGLTPGAENASRGFITAASLHKVPGLSWINPWYRTFHETVDDTQNLTLLSMLQGNEKLAPAHLKEIRRSHSDAWSRTSAWFMNKMTTWLPLPVPIQPVLTHRYKIDVAHEPSV